MEGRWIVVPAWFTGLMAKDNRFVSGATPMSESNIRNGIAGTVAGFTLIQSNNVPTVGGTKYKLVAGVPGGIAYVEQIRKTEAYRPERRFADAVKGLHLYGAKVVRPELLAVATVLRT
jgi:phosphoglucomutase